MVATKKKLLVIILGIFIPLFSATHEQMLIKSIRERYNTPAGTQQSLGVVTLSKEEIIKAAIERYKKNNGGQHPKDGELLHFMAAPEAPKEEGSFLFSGFCKSVGYFFDREVADLEPFEQLLVALEYGDCSRIETLINADVLEWGLYSKGKKAPLLGGDWVDPFTKALAYAAVAQGSESLLFKRQKSDQLVALLHSYRVVKPCSESPDGSIIQCPQKRGLLWWGLQYQDFSCVERAIKEGTDVTTTCAPFHEYSPLAMALAGFHYGLENLGTVEALVGLLLSHQACVEKTAAQQFVLLEKAVLKHGLSMEGRFMGLRAALEDFNGSEQVHLKRSEKVPKELEAASESLVASVHNSKSSSSSELSALGFIVVENVDGKQ